MREKKRFGLFTGIAVLLLLAFASAALAKPDWVTVKYTGTQLRKQKNTKVGDGNHLLLVHKFDIINNSKNGDIITAIFDRKIRWNGVFTIVQMTSTTQYFFDGKNSTTWKPAHWNVKFGMTGTNPYKGEWYPGQVYKYEHTIPLNKLIKPYDGSWKTTNEAAFKKFNFKFDKWSLDFQVRSHR